MNYQHKKRLHTAASMFLFGIGAVIVASALFSCQAAYSQGLALKAKVATPTITAGFSRDTPSAYDLTLQAIEGADKSLYIAAYQFTNPSIIRAVIAAKARGVDVEVVLDKSQAKGDSQAVLVAAGIGCRISSNFKIMHHKFMVVDGETVETGSFNYTLNAVKGNAENALLIQNAPKLAEQFKAQWDTINAAAKPCKGGGQ